jgi:protein KRI1
MREVRRKLEMIGRQAGFKMKGKGKNIVTADEEDSSFVDDALQELDLEGEWDPEKHDRQMAGLFDRDAEAFEDEGGGPDEGLGFDEDGKPMWDDGIDIGDIAIPDDDVLPNESRKKERKKKKKKTEQSNDDGGVDIDAMDADVELKFEDDEEWDGTEEMRKRVLMRYMDELDTLDFNDMVCCYLFQNLNEFIVVSKYRLGTCLRDSDISPLNPPTTLLLLLKSSRLLTRSLTSICP